MHSPQRVRHTTRLLLGLTGALLLALPANAAPATDQNITVDLSSTTGSATGVGSGFLYGLNQDGSGPSDSLLAPLNPTSGRGGGARLPGGGWVGDGYQAGSGYQARISSALGQARRLTTGAYHASDDLLVSDVWGADTTQPSNTVYPCTNGDCSNWISFLDRMMSDVSASGLTPNFDIWNEPDGPAFFAPGVNTTQYFAMWDSAVREIRRLDPGATIVGPSLSGWQYANLGPFLDHVKSANTVPNILNWHFSGNPIADAQTADSMLSARGISGVRLSINEYIFGNQQNAGYEAWYLGQLAKSGISSASHAIWTDCCVAGTLDSTLVPDGSGNLQPTGQWWVYREYAQVSGTLVSVNNNGGSTDAVASEDQNAGRAAILLGDSSGNTGNTNLTINGLTSRPWLASGSGIAVTVQRIPDQNPLSAPITVGTQIVAAGTNSVQVPINWQSANDAYFVTLTPAASTVIVDGATTSGTDYFSYGANWGQTNGVADMYDGTANWSYIPGSVAQLHFTGRQVALHAVRDVDQGEMSLSVDGGSPVTIDDYAPSRNASGVVWTSPVFASGQHTLTITVQQKDATSSGNNIAIDRADIS
jgi:hypothetical protein